VAHGGLPGDIPVPGDYDADGDTDVAIYRSSTAGWYIKDQFTVGYGLSTDYPVPAPDTNGDGDPYQ
jgi:single-stranded DNA-specific DHH superfamily exonuclease